MSIDWNTAPEGATHAGIIPSRNTNVWYRDIDPVRGRYEYFSLMDESWHISGGSPLAQELIPRPAESAPAALTWDGQGLPPVGTTCIVEPHNTLWGFSSTSGHERKILAYHTDYVWLGNGDTPLETTRIDKVDFRPIPTPEQIAAEEREKAIEEMCFAEETLTVKQAKALYEAGYRRQESST